MHDDITIILSAKNNNLLFQKGNQELKNIDNWLIAKKLSLNVKKKQNIFYSALIPQKHCQKNQF